MYKFLMFVILIAVSGCNQNPMLSNFNDGGIDEMETIGQWSTRQLGAYEECMRWYDDMNCASRTYWHNYCQQHPTDAPCPNYVDHINAEREAMNRTCIETVNQVSGLGCTQEFYEVFNCAADNCETKPICSLQRQWDCSSAPEVCSVQVYNYVSCTNLQPPAGP